MFKVHPRRGLSVAAAAAALILASCATPEPEPAVVREHAWHLGLSSLWRGRHEADLPPAPEAEPDTQPPGFRQVLATSLDIMQDRIGRSRLAGDPPDLLISPWLGEVEPLEFTGGRSSIEEGHRSVQRMLPALEYLLGLQPAD